MAVHDGGRSLAEFVTVDAHRHAELLAPAIDQVIADAKVSRRDLTAIAAGVGPGPYTGLRVGLVTARVIGAALGVPVYGVCSLDVIAADASIGETGEGDGEFLVATDARRRELYWARYDAAGGARQGPRYPGPLTSTRRGCPLRGRVRCCTGTCCPTGAAPPTRPPRRCAGSWRRPSRQATPASCCCRPIRCTSAAQTSANRARQSA